LGKTNDNWFYNNFIILDQSNKLEQKWKATDEYSISYFKFDTSGTQGCQMFTLGRVWDPITFTFITSQTVTFFFIDFHTFLYLFIPSHTFSYFITLFIRYQTFPYFVTLFSSFSTGLIYHPKYQGKKFKLKYGYHETCCTLGAWKEICLEIFLFCYKFEQMQISLFCISFAVKMQNHNFISQKMQPFLLRAINAIFYKLFFFKVL